MGVFLTIYSILRVYLEDKYASLQIEGRFIDHKSVRELLGVWGMGFNTIRDKEECILCKIFWYAECKSLNFLYGVPKSKKRQ